MNKKIIVSGCSNCPYLIVWNDGNGNGIDSITRGTCNHPSYHKELPKPEFFASVFLHYEVDGSEKVSGLKARDTYSGCPLPDDITND